MGKNQQEMRYAKWRELLKEHEKSGLSQKKFCQERKILPSQLTYYRSRTQGKPTVKENLFSPVHIRKNYTAVDVQVVLPNGIKCILPCAADVAYVRQIVGALLSC